VWGWETFRCFRPPMDGTARRLSLRPARERSVGGRVMGVRRGFCHSEPRGLYECDVSISGEDSKGLAPDPCPNLSLVDDSPARVVEERGRVCEAQHVAE